jgi:amidase
MTRRTTPRRTRAARIAGSALAATAAALAGAAPASAVNSVTTGNGAIWQIHDAAAPALDSGSIRAITGNALYGFGNLKVRVSGIPAGDPTGRFNGEMMRGFGLKFDGVDGFRTTDAVTMGGVAMRRSVRVSRSGNFVRYLDAFTNDTSRTITVDASFGGTTGFASGENQSEVLDTSSGDKAAGADDAWVEVGTPDTVAGSPTFGASTRGPSAVVFGTPAPFSGALFGLGNQQRDPFGSTLPTSGLDANFWGYKNRVTLQPGATRSLLRYVVAGRAETAATSGTQVSAVRSQAVDLAAAPDLSELGAGEICSIANWDVSALPGFDASTCASAAPPEPPATKPAGPAVTTSRYDVVGKSITQLQADMEAGRTTSQEITRGYLDRIAAYDTDQFGFHAFITVAGDAMGQAKAADVKRAGGARGDLLGIPMAIKDLYDTKDMPTTDGTLALEGWQPKRDAFQVKRMRDAGAVMIGKTNLSEFANSGSYSESGYAMSWNAFKPSKTTLGSSGGSAVAVATSMAGAAMGSQTGVSLYAPATGAGLVTMRGTDGIASGGGVMPLTWLQDFEGPMARTTSDVARILNATTGTDPDDIATVHADADARRPADFKASLDPDALQGKRIGYLPAAFTGNPASYGQQDGTVEAVMARFADIRDAGAEVVEITTAPPAAPPAPNFSGRSRAEEGWQRYFELHENPPYKTAAEILSSPRVLPYNRRTVAPAPRLTKQDIDAIFAQRDEYKARVKAWMDAANVDAVVYPGFRSDVYDNDGAQTLSSDRNTGVLTSNVGLPTLVLPVGANPQGDPISLQFVGRAFEDGKVLGLGHALEQQLKGAGQLLPATAPRLAYDADATPTPIVIERPEQPRTPAPFEAPENAAQPATTTAPAPSASAPARRSRPSVTLPATARVLSGGRVRLTLRNTGRSAVTGTVVLRTRAVRFGTARVRVAAGRTVTMTVRLAPAARRALRGRSRLRVAATYALRTADGATLRSRRGLVLRTR